MEENRLLIHLVTIHRALEVELQKKKKRLLQHPTFSHIFKPIEKELANHFQNILHRAAKEFNH